MLYHGDCLEIIPHLIPAGSIDLILCDLPYGITSAGFDCEIDLQRLWPQLWRIARPHCPVVLTASQPFTSVMVVSQIEHFKHEWVWIKNRGSNFANTVREPMKEHESILVFARGKWTYNKQMQARTGGVASRVEYDFNHRTATENYGKFDGKEGQSLPPERVPSSWQKFNTEVGLHPQQKPVDLFRYLIRTYSNPGMTVLDFSSGSGTTAIAALREDRRYICIEKELRFVEAAKARIEAEKDAAPLFAAAK
jgi:site-specific DNA-methyltransferase (adenine-specific)